MRKLVDLDIKRIALVDKAANRRRFLLHKREEDGTMDEKEKKDLIEKIEKETREKIEKEQADAKAKADKEAEEARLKAEKDGTTIPVEVLAAGMPEEVKSEIGAALKSLNTAMGSLAKLMGFGYSGSIKAPEKEEKKKESDADKAEMDEMLSTLTDAIETMKGSIVTKDDVEKMIGDILGKKEEKKED